MNETSGELNEIARKLLRSRNRNHGLTIVITGASSGIGLMASQILSLMNPQHRLILVARTRDDARIAVEKVAELQPTCLAQRQQNDDDDDRRVVHLIPLVCDHCSLSSVRAFCTDLQRVLEDTYRPEQLGASHRRGIDVLCLNAAVLMPESPIPTFTGDGIETTFQTNYVSAFLIVNLLAPVLNAGARVVFSASGLYLHCPPIHVHVRDGGGDGGVGVLARAPPPKTDTQEDGIIRCLGMLDGSAYHYKRAYAVSKQCIVALCLSLHNLWNPIHNSHHSHHSHSEYKHEHNRPFSRRMVSTCFSPGLMLQSDLFRHHHDTTTTTTTTPMNHHHHDPHDSHSSHSSNSRGWVKSVAWGAGALVYMAISDAAGQQSGVYWSDAAAAAAAAALAQEGCPQAAKQAQTTTTDCSRQSQCSQYGKEFCAGPILDDESSLGGAAARRQLWRFSCELASLRPEEEVSPCS